MNETEERAALVHEHDVKKFSLLFMAAATLVEIISAFLCIAVLYICVGFAAYKVLNAKTAIPLQLASPVVFIGGLFAGYKIYKRLMRIAIDTFHLKSRLRKDVYNQYLTRQERQKEAMR